MLWRRPIPSHRRRGRRRWEALGTILALAAIQLTFVAAVPVAGGPRPEDFPTPIADVSPPTPVTSAAFTTYDTKGDGADGIWRPPPSTLPLRFVVEQEVVDRFGAAAIEDAVAVYNDTLGSRFGAVVDEQVTTDAEARRRDGVNRIYIDQRACGQRYLARANLWPGAREVRDGRLVQHIAEVDIGLCARVRPEQLDVVIAHELGHAAGLGHLCDAGEPCHTASMDDDNRCRVMARSSDPCQAVTEGDRAGLVHLHPVVGRIAGGDGRSTAGAVTLAGWPAARAQLRVVASAHDAPIEQRLAGAQLAGHLEVPHLLVDEDCTNGTDGTALNRTLAIAGRVVMVGEVPDTCQAALEGAWDLGVQRLDGPIAVSERIARIHPDPEVLVAAPTRAPDRQVPLATVAAAAAVRADVPMVGLPDPDDLGPLADAVDRAGDRLRELVVVADASLVSDAALEAFEAELDEPLEVTRVAASDPGTAATTLARFPLDDGPAADVLTLVDSRRGEHAIPAISRAATADAALLPIDRELREDHAQLLLEVDAATVVGGPQGIGDRQQRGLSRLVDRPASR